jgi:hypothetical protein
MGLIEKPVLNIKVEYLTLIVSLNNFKNANLSTTF